MGQIGLAKDLELQQAVAQVEKERDAAQNALVLQEQKQELALATTRQEYEVRLKAADEQVEFYKISRLSSLLRQLRELGAIC